MMGMQSEPAQLFYDLRVRACGPILLASAIATNFTTDRRWRPANLYRDTTER